MARSVALNPTSMPFFPGNSRLSEDDGTGGFGFGVPTPREQDRASVSTLSISPVEHRSVRSSPSPPQDHGGHERYPDPRFRSSPLGMDRQPGSRQIEFDRQYPPRTREMSKVGSLEALPEGDDTQGSVTTDSGAHTPGHSSPFFSAVVQQARARNSTPPVNISDGPSRASSFNTNGPFTSSSPVSSLDSGSQFAPSNDFLQSLEAQLKASPLIHDILDRLVRCEYSTREIQRDLSDVHRKVTILVERSINNPIAPTSQPEFKDPFAPSASLSGTITGPPLNGPRASFSGNIAPNQSPPGDDITQISQRLNTLTTSVGQLLALQTQQHIQNATSNMSNNQPIGRTTPQVPDLALNQGFPPGQCLVLPIRPCAPGLLVR
ncbi:hypothetical protein BV22DRAFT_90098 [Leucogyrophana mollusca]|uniref:Uncharacterized protein n=1 Tax=Leucogyrophana mollusca TaxID=85980 RepID=A0ACB8BVX2_9AGAM|nr:hypothetical protein BV22DRAFT_90098 [Leucogyrophana mollusca]